MVTLRIFGGIISIGGAIVPGGSNKAIQFNDNGAFGGDLAFQWDKTTKTVTLDSATPSSITPVTIKAIDTGGLQIATFDGDGGLTFTATLGFSDLILTSAGDIDTLLYVSNTSNGIGASAHMSVVNDQFDVLDFNIYGSGSLIAPREGSISTQGTSTNLRMSVNGNSLLFFDTTQNIVIKQTSNAAADTNGFLYVPLLTGNQTGVPAKLTGDYANSAPIRLQNNSGVYSLKAYINGGWRSVAMV